MGRTFRLLLVSNVAQDIKKLAHLELRQALDLVGIVIPLIFAALLLGKGKLHHLEKALEINLRGACGKEIRMC